MKDLEFYPTNDLFDELGKRFDSIVLIGEKQHSKSNDRIDSKFYEGNILKCLGLLKVLEKYLLSEYSKNLKTVSAEET